MVIIYDFDGTLTPYPLPQYEIIKRCNYNTKKLMELVRNIIESEEKNLYDAYFKAIHTILKDNNLQFDSNNICLGSKKVVFNNGVLDFFESLKNTDINHFVVSSGFEDYIRETKIMDYLTDVYGTTMDFSNDQYIIKRLVTDKYKVQLIKNIISYTKCGNDIIYIGDGLTDKYAFEYVHSIGGKTIFICKDKYKNTQYTVLNELGIIDECFEPDFSIQKEIYQYIKNKIR